MFNFQFQGRKISTPRVSYSVLPLVALCGFMLVQAPAFSAQELTPEQARIIIDSSVQHQVPVSAAQVNNASSQMSQPVPVKQQYDNTQRSSATQGELAPVKVDELYEDTTVKQNVSYKQATNSNYSDSSQLTVNDADADFKPFARKPAKETHSASVQERFENLGETDLPTVEEYDQSILRKIDEAKAQQGVIVNEVNTDFNNRPAMARTSQMIEAQPRVTQQRVQLFDTRIAATVNNPRYDNSPSLFQPVNEAALFSGKSASKSKSSNVKSANKANDAYIPPAQPVEKRVEPVETAAPVIVETPEPSQPPAVEVSTETEVLEKTNAEGTEVLQIEKVAAKDLVKPATQAPMSQEALANKLTEESNLDTPDLRTTATPEEFYQQQQVEKQVKDIKQEASKQVMLDDLESKKTEALNKAQQNMQDTSNAVVETPQQVLNETQQPMTQMQMQRALNEIETAPLPSSYERNGIVENFDSYQEVDVDSPSAAQENLGLEKETAVPASPEKELIVPKTTEIIEAEKKEVVLPVNQEMILNKETGVIAGEEAQILTVEDAKKAIEEQSKK